ncbi:MAG: four helix bundle protein [Candidatus Berkelbacteria bacterium]
MESFEKLDAWKSAKELALKCYEITKLFPKEEQFSLTSQTRRAAISVVSNIAEALSRLSIKDQSYFFQMATGSLYELKAQFIIATELNFMKKTDLDIVSDSIIRTLKLINGYKRYLSSKNL